MKRFGILLSLLYLIMGYTSIAMAQKDTEFWFVAPEVNDQHGNAPNQGQPTYLRFSAGEIELEVTIEQPSNPAFTPIVFNVGGPDQIDQTASIKFERNPGGGVYDLDLIENEFTDAQKPANLAPGDIGNISSKGLKITAKNVNPDTLIGEMSVYYEISASNNKDIMTLKGKNALGTEFFVPFQTHFQSLNTISGKPLLYSAIDIVATEPSTEIRITPTEPMLIIRNTGYQQWPANTEYVEVLEDAGDVFCAVPYGGGNISDFPISRSLALTGTQVVADNPVAVHTKQDLVHDGTNSVDIIADQIVPTSMLGSEYVVMRGDGLNNTEYAYVLGIQDGTKVEVNGAPFGTVNARGFLQVPLNDDYTHITSADTSVLVYHAAGVPYTSTGYLGTTTGTQLGGAVIPTIDMCTGSDEVFFTRMSDQTFVMNIMVYDANNAIDNFYLNGSPMNIGAEFSSIPGVTKWQMASIEFPVSEIGVGDAYKITNTKQVFHLGILNGEADCFYGYFSNFNPMEIKARIANKETDIEPLCYGDEIQLYAQGGSSYYWTSNLSPAYISDPTSQNPVVYPLEDRVYTVEVMGYCEMTATDDVVIKVSTPIEAVFSADSVLGCSPFDVRLHNRSGENYSYTWADWDFGDGSPILRSSDEFIYHTYSNTTGAPANYTIKLLTSKTPDCRDSMTVDVTVFPEISADFVPDTTACNPVSVPFRNNSSGDTDLFLWRFGDGATSDSENPSHTYVNPSDQNDTTYHVQLEVIAPNKFCRDTAFRDVTVHPQLVAGFALNTDRACAPFQVSFANTSVGADHLYWDLGDGTTVDMASIDTLFHTYENTTTIPMIYPVSLEVVNSQGCSEVFHDTITVLPQVVADYVVSANEGCNNATIEFTNQSSPVATMHLWKFGDGVSTTTTDATHTYQNTYGHDTTFTFQMAAMSPHGCIDDTSGTVTIYSAIADYNVDTDEGCSPLPVTVTNNSTGSNLSYQWDYGDGYTATDPLPADNPHTFTNATGTPQAHDLSLIVSGNGGCADTLVTPITVYSSVDADFLPVNAVGCDSIEIAFDNQSSSFLGGHTATYAWSFGDGATSSEAEPVHVFRNFGANDTTYNVQLQVTTANGCTDMITYPVLVLPRVKADFSVAQIAGCSPFTAEVQTTPYAGNATYSWDFGAAGTDNVVQPGAKIYTLNSGGSQENDIILTVTDASGNCQDQKTIPVEVYSSVVSSFTTTPAQGCNPLDVTLQSTSDAWAQDLSWEFGDGSSANATGAGNSQHHIYYNASDLDATYTAELQVATEHGCADTSTQDVTVYPFVLADFAINRAQGCSPLEIEIDNRSFGGNYRIYYDDDNLAGPADYTMSAQGAFTHTYTNTSGSPQTHQLTLIADNGQGCLDTLKRSITVYSSIDAQFAMDVAEGCTPLEVDFDNTTQFASKYQWTFDDGASSNAEDVSHQFNNLDVNDRTYQIKLVAESPFGCVDSITQPVNVWSYVEANFSIENNEGCPPFDVVFDNTSVGNASDTYSWSIDGVAESTAPTNKDDFSHQFANNTVNIREYEVQLVATNTHGCTTEKTDVIRVYENVTADFQLSSTGACTPMEMQYTDLSSVPANTVYRWDFGDGASSGAQEPAHVFYNTSRTTDINVTTKLRVTSPRYCTDSISKTFLVYHQPKAEFEVDQTSSCPPLEVNMKNKSIGADQFVWRLGDGNTSTNDELAWSYDNTTNAVKDYKLELWNSTIHGCKDSTSLILNVFPRVEAAFNYDTSGCSPFVSSFINESVNADFYYWDFADGNTSNQSDPIHRFSNNTDVDKVYDVYMRASSEYNCEDEVTHQVTTFAQPIAEFNVDPIVQRFPENRVFITDASNAGPWSYEWTLDDGNVETGDINFHDYEHWGSYDITLALESNTSHCADAVTRSVTILPPEINARFSTDRVDGCAPLTVEFDAAASIYNEEYEYTWDFGDGTTDKGASPTHVFDQYGTYMVKLTATGEGGSDYAYRKITVYPVPEADFDLAPRVSMLNEEMQARVEFYNLSTCGDTLGCNYLWDFGDGNTSTRRDVVHHYEALGQYDVNLRVTSTKGCVNNITLENAVEVIGEGIIKFPNAFIPSEEGPNAGYYNTPDYKNQVFHPVTKGVIDYHLVIYNRWGEIVFETRDLEIGWDGYIDGKLAKQDVYVYKATGKFTNGEPFEKVGDVTLIQ